MNNKPRIDSGRNLLQLRHLHVRELTVGDAGNFFKVSPTGKPTFESGDDPYKWFDNYEISALSMKEPTSNAPGLGKLKDDGSGSHGVYVYWFDDSTEESLYFSTQFSAQFKDNSRMVPYIHWMVASSLSTNQVCWGIEMSIANLLDTTYVYGTTDIIYKDTKYGSGNAYEALISNFGSYDLANYENPLIVGRVFRDAGGSGGTDNFTGDAAILGLSFEIDIEGLVRER